VLRPRLVRERFLYRHKTLRTRCNRFLYRVYASKVPVKISKGVRTIYNLNVTTVHTLSLPHVTSGFRREVDAHCTLLSYYSASSGNFLPTFRDNQSVPSSGAEILVVPKRR
jgi:hypothetical protein